MEKIGLQQSFSKDIILWTLHSSLDVIKKGDCGQMHLGK